VSARRLAVNHPRASSRDKIQNLVTYHTKRRDAIENHHEMVNLNLFSVRIRKRCPPKIRAASTSATATDVLWRPVHPVHEGSFRRTVLCKAGRVCSAKIELPRARPWAPATCAQHEDYEAVRNMFTRDRPCEKLSDDHPWSFSLAPARVSRRVSRWTKRSRLWMSQAWD